MDLTWFNYPSGWSLWAPLDARWASPRAAPSSATSFKDLEDFVDPLGKPSTRHWYGIDTKWGPRSIAKLVYNSNNYGLRYL